MIMEHLLKKFKYIQPDSDFKEHSKMLIFSTPQQQPESTAILILSQLLAPKTAVALGLIFLLFLLGGFNLFNSTNNSQPALTHLDPKKLTEEAKNLDIQIRLSQVKYYEDSLKKVEVALSEASGEIAN